MSKITILLSFVILLNFSELQSADNSNPSKLDIPAYIITIKSENIDDAYLFLSRRESGSWSNIDSALVSLGKDVIFKGKLANPEVLYLRLENSDKTISFFAENSDIIILPDFENPDNAKVEGSDINKELELYQSMFTEMEEEKAVAYEEYMTARKEKDQKKMDEVIALYEKFSDQELKMNKKFISSNAESHVSPYIIRSKMYHSLSLQELKNLVFSLDPTLNQSVYVQFLRNHISTLEKVAIGEKFVDFSMLSPEGNPLALSELVGGKYLLIDFWASWCGPCRQENPNVVKMYNDLQEKGFEIVGVSFDHSDENWKKAIQDDNLTWPQMSDLKGWGSEAGKLYGISSIPSTILLDPNGIIIEKNLRGDELYKKLEELLEEFNK